MKRKGHYLFIICIILAVCTSVSAQRPYYAEYFNQYSDMAIDQMHRYRIPASITLAQGVFESGAGQSSLAKYFNNHFGIKCGVNWRGKTTLKDDDAPNECFRVYDNAKDSYEDHSLFLSKGPRYQFLFRLDMTDYRGWAVGLKKAGYATDPSYANRLIAIIEQYQLYKYDNASYKKERRHHRHSEEANVPIFKHNPLMANDVVYIIARTGDTFDTLSEEFGISARKLAKYNDVERDYNIQNGDIIYLHKKQRRAAKGCIVHVVSDGDSMHGISQHYGMRLKNLYKLNNKDGDYVPMVGDILRLR